MDENIESATKYLACPGKGTIKLLIDLHVARNNLCIRNFGSQITHVPLHALLVGQSNLRSFTSQCLSNSPTNRTMIGNTKNKGFLPLQQGHTMSPLLIGSGTIKHR